MVFDKLHRFNNKSGKHHLLPRRRTNFSALDMSLCDMLKIFWEITKYSHEQT